MMKSKRVGYRVFLMLDNGTVLAVMHIDDFVDLVGMSKYPMGSTLNDGEEKIYEVKEQEASHEK